VRAVVQIGHWASYASRRALQLFFVVVCAAMQVLTTRLCTRSYMQLALSQGSACRVGLPRAVAWDSHACGMASEAFEAS
jgi:hypothetical protein